MMNATIASQPAIYMKPVPCVGVCLCRKAFSKLQSDYIFEARLDTSAASHPDCVGPNRASCICAFSLERRHWVMTHRPNDPEMVVERSERLSTCIIKVILAKKVA